eukprot:UN00569
MALTGLFGADSDTDSNDDDDEKEANNQCLNVFQEKKKSKCPNVDMSHITQHEFDNIVYEPSSDSYLLMDCIENDGKLLNEIFKSKTLNSTIAILEIGSGSGIVLTHTYNVIKVYCAECIKNRKLNISLFALDINFDALQITKNTMFNNGIKRNECTLINSDLLSAINIETFYPKIDILLLNPPYVPTTREELNKSQNDKLLSAAWSGGIHGTDIIYKFIKQSNFYKLLSNHSLFYLVTIAMNKPNQIIHALEQPPYNLHAQILAKKRVVPEMLVIIKFSKAY